MRGILNGASRLLPGSPSAAGRREGRPRLRSLPAFVVGLNQPAMDGGTAVAHVIQSKLGVEFGGWCVPAEVHTRL